MPADVQRVSSGTIWELTVGFSRAVRVGPFELVPFAVYHPVEAYGIRVTGPSSVRPGERVTLVYSGDTDACDGLVEGARGADLFAATHLHRLLQEVFGWPVPVYAHHKLLLDEAGERLAKRRNAPRLRDLRDAGMAPEEVWRRAGLILKSPAGSFHRGSL